MAAANRTGTAAMLECEEKAADQTSRLRSLASGISGDEVVIAEGEEI